MSEEEGSLLHVGFGVRYTNANEGVRFQTRPEFNSAPVFADTNPPDSGNTGHLAAERAVTYNVELSARRGPLWLAGEYVRTNVTAPAHGNPSFSGYHVTASWILTGEMRGYNRRSGVFNQVPIARPVRQGGWGAWEVAARWSDLDLSDAMVDGGELEVLSLGVNWWLSRAAMLSADYRDVSLDRFWTIGASKGFTTRLVLILE